MINVSIVRYKNPLTEIAQLVNTLRKSEVVNKVYLIDNSPTPLPGVETLAIDYHFNNKNTGYGSAHNIAIRKSIQNEISYHLVVNPDIYFEPEVLDKIADFLNNNTDIGHLMPKILYPDGQIQYLCKQIPTPFDLIFRRFLPLNWTKNRRDKFELRASGYNKTMDIPYLSGCFMFLRTNILKEVGLFDERFFMYPEDIDLTRRIHKKYRTVFYPEATVIHNHAQGSYRSYKMLWIHISNMIKYFNKWGWIIDNDRKKINKETLNKLNIK